MVTAELGACEWFVWDLRSSNLVERGMLDQLVQDFMSHNPQAEPPELADFLVAQKILTRFQADSILNGKNQGLVLGPYVVADALGTGSMGTVYKAYSKNNNNWYAVKVLPRRSMWNIRLARRKVREFEEIDHPAVVRFVDVGTAGSTHYLVWPLVEGEPLNKVVEQAGRLSPGEAALYALQTAEGLELCHAKGLLHGLLKPSNLLISPDKQVYLLDLGIGSLLQETENESVVDTMSTANTMASGLDCASPEGIMDPTQMTPASDQYSLGCVLYYCLTGQYPFPGSNAVEKMMAHQTRQPTPVKELVPDVPDDLAAIVERLMQKQPKDRYASISEVIIDLRPFALEAAGPHGLSRRGKSSPRMNQNQKANQPAQPQRPPIAPTGAGRPLQPPRAAAKPIVLPDRRSLEVGAPAPPPRPSGEIRPGVSGSSVAVPLPRSNSGVHRPNPRIPPQPMRDVSKKEDKPNLLVIVGLGLIACVVGWLLAGWL